MNLKDVIKAVPDIIKVFGDQTVSIENLTANSQQKEENSLFFCITGLKSDGHAHAKEAVENGAVALVVERHLPDIHCSQI